MCRASSRRKPPSAPASRWWFLLCWQLHDFGMTGNEHEKLFKAIMRKDAKTASAAMAVHVENLRGRIVATKR